MSNNDNKRILIIEDDPDIPELIDIHLRDLEFSLDHAEEGNAGLQKALAEDYALLILDLMLPGIDGLEICRRIRQEKKQVPILMLTSRSEEMDKVLGLELGADDYLTKPFGIREFMARVKALLRRTEQTRSPDSHTSDSLVFDNLMILTANRRVILDEKDVGLTNMEYELLLYMAGSPGRAFNRQQLLDQVWGYQFTGYEHTVNSHINRLRAKIESNPAKPKFIKTVWGIRL